MTKGTDLSAAIEQQLLSITPANGYHTDIKGVYGFSQVKKDNDPLPCLLVRVDEDAGDSVVGVSVKRQARYVIEGVFSRAASLHDLQRCHHDILRALSYGQPADSRSIQPAAITEETVQYDPEEGGGTHRRLLATLAIRYVERYA